jgi:transposase
VKWAGDALDEVRRGAWNDARALARREPKRGPRTSPRTSRSSSPGSPRPTRNCIGPTCSKRPCG